jgi:hypothetical protein
MPESSDYRTVDAGEWRLVLVSGHWSFDLQQRVLDLVERQPWARHPQTITLQVPQDGREGSYYVKVFHPARGGAAFKDIFRDSKAFRAWRQGVALKKAGFEVPLTIAAGERRRWRFLRRAFILTRKVDAQALQSFLRDSLDRRGDKALWQAKREALKRASVLIRKFHLQGFVHGDLVASNLLVAHSDGGRTVFYFMDNDRTRRYPTWLPQRLWKRNLVQLNRMPLPGITLQDRVRFLRDYLGTDRLSQEDRRLARWLERKTRRRREACDGVAASGDFRRLMSWSADGRSSDAEGAG